MPLTVLLGKHGNCSLLDDMPVETLWEGDIGFSIVLPDQNQTLDDPYLLGETNLCLNGNFSQLPVDFRITARVAYDGTALPSSVGLYQFDEVFQDSRFFLDLREAFLSWDLADFQFRFGLQFLDWGQIDEWNITDLANTEDYRQFVLRLEKDRKIGLPALSAKYHLKSWVFQTFYAPTWVPYRLANVGERWFSPYANSIKRLVIPENIFNPIWQLLLPESLTIPLSVKTRDIASPEWFHDFQAGARLRKTWGPNMIGLLYFIGTDPFPSFDAEATFRSPRTLFIPELTSSSQLDITLFPVQRRIQMWGIEFSTTVKSLAFRGEVAYIMDRTYNKFYRPDDLPLYQVDSEGIAWAFIDQLLTRPNQSQITIPIPLPEMIHKTDELQAGLQVDRFYKNLFISLALVYSQLTSPATDLFVEDEDLMLLVMVYQDFLKWNLSLKASAAGHIKARDGLVYASIERTWKDHLLTELGILWVQGPTETLLGQFSPNNQLFLRISYRL